MLTVNALTAADGCADTDAVRVLRLEGLSALAADDRTGSRFGESPISRCTASCEPCTTRASTSPTKCRCNSSNTSIAKYSAPSCRATFVLAEAPSFGLPVLLHDRSSRGAIAYLALAGEVLRREDDRMAEAV